jgi:hypothetical protein
MSLDHFTAAMWTLHKQFLSILYPTVPASTQLYISMAIVIGPTPPGTGVMALHTGATSS